MDPELKAYLDQMVLAITDHVGARLVRIEQRLERVEQRLDTLEHRVDAMHLEFAEKFASVDERFRSLELRMEQFEIRITDRLDALVVHTERLDRRVSALEHHLIGVNTRLDGMAADTRQRFRILTERVASIETVLAA